jgi:hypothetical protein
MFMFQSVTLWQLGRRGSEKANFVKVTPLLGISSRPCPEMVEANTPSSPPYPMEDCANTTTLVHAFAGEWRSWATSEWEMYYESCQMARSIGFKFLTPVRCYWAAQGRINGCGACRDDSTEAGLQQWVSSFAKSLSISGICRKWAKVSIKIADATASRGARRR